MLVTGARPTIASSGGWGYTKVSRKRLRRAKRQGWNIPRGLDLFYDAGHTRIELLFDAAPQHRYAEYFIKNRLVSHQQPIRQDGRAVKAHDSYVEFLQLPVTTSAFTNKLYRSESFPPLRGSVHVEKSAWVRVPLLSSSFLRLVKCQTFFLSEHQRQRNLEPGCYFCVGVSHACIVASACIAVR